MIKYTLIFAFVFLLGFTKSNACTSFVLYGDDIWIGHNLDNSYAQVKIILESNEHCKILKGAFPNGTYFTAMNSNGLFVNFQNLYYNGNSPDFIYGAANTLNLQEIRDYAINNCSVVNEVINFIGNNTVVPGRSLVLHSMFADVKGNALIIDPMGDKTGMVLMQDSIAVMTNFPNSEFNGLNYEEVYGVGSGRYKTAMKYLKMHRATKANFSVEKGFSLLEKVSQSSGSYQTVFSVLFHPSKMEAFICLDRDFSKIWRVSLSDQILETYSGFDGYKKISITSFAIPTSSFPYPNVSTSKTDLSTEKEVLIYPNPARDVINVQATTDIEMLTLYDLTGNVVLQQQIVNKVNYKIDLTSVPTGIYIMKIVTINGFAESAKVQVLQK